MMRKTAFLSEDKLYRYKLTRQWAEGPLLTFVGLNPSTADDIEDDPTIRRCVGFAQREAVSGLLMINLYAYRATEPIRLRQVNDPVGPSNEAAWDEAFYMSTTNKLPIICAWGVNDVLYNGHEFVVRAQRAKVKLVCLGKTKVGHPKHPLYLKTDTPLEPFP